MKFYVYFLIDPITNTVFYVGKGSIHTDRHLHHFWEFLEWDRLGRFYDMRPKWNLKKLRKIAKIMDAGLEIKYEIAFETDNEQEALLQEVNCIAAFGRENLTNLTDGGEGTSGYEFTEEQKIKMGNSLKGHKHSEETKEKLRDTSLRFWSNNNNKEAMAEIHRNRVRNYPDSTKKRMSELHEGENNPFYGKKHSADTKKKMRISRLGKKRGPYKKTLSPEKSRV